MNLYDSNRMLDILISCGYEHVSDCYLADLVILNTCYIREKSYEKIFSDLGRVKKIQDERRLDGSDIIISVSGCVAQAGAKEIRRRAPYIDIIFGPQVYHRLPYFLSKVLNYRKLNKKSFYFFGARILDIDFPIKSKFSHLKFPKAKGVSSFISIQEGCDKFCHFCVVPYTRGAEVSRPIKDIIFEATLLVEQGVKEIILLGQNVNAYHGKNSKGKFMSLSSLLYFLSEIKGLERLRYITSHPKEMSDDLIASHKQNSKLMPYLHLPIQSGSNRILKSMNRGHTVEYYKLIVEKLRLYCPNIVFSSDFIVGYPGESDQDFEETLKLIKYIIYQGQSFSFKYSSRLGTPAAELKEQVKEDIKLERLEIIQKLLSQQQKKFNSSLLGTMQPVLIEKYGRKKNQKIGLSPYAQVIYFEDYNDDYNIGDFVQVQIEESGLKSLGGRLIL